MHLGGRLDASEVRSLLHPRMWRGNVVTTGQEVCHEGQNR
jgi:hypothetical protein